MLQDLAANANNLRTRVSLEQSGVRTSRFAIGG
jgi:hypothetical protein